MEAQNLAGYGIPSIPVSVKPSPVCDAETLGGGTDGNLKFQGGPNVYLYFGLLGLPEPKGAVIGVTDQTSGIKHITSRPGSGDRSPLVPGKCGSSNWLESRL